MKYELWYSESECFGVLLCEGDTSSLKGSGARLIWTVEANTYEEAVQKRDEFLELTGTTFVSLRDREALQGFFASGADRPDRSTISASREPTTRITSVTYLDNEGDQCSVDVPGWVSLIADLVAHLAEAKAGFSALLGQIYVERPYRDLTSAPDEITVVDLRSYDGNSRMIQEFSGHIDNQAQIGELVSQRLGPLVPHWRIVEANLLRRSSDAGKPSASPQRQDAATSNSSPQKQPCPCGSGKTFAECHGSG